MDLMTLKAINQEREAEVLRLRLAAGASDARVSAALSLRRPSAAWARRITMSGGLASLFGLLRRPVRANREA